MFRRLRSLVTVRRYPYWEAATGDHQLLLSAGIEAILKGRRGVWLMVPADRVADAHVILESSPQLVQIYTEPLPRCPTCHTPNPDAGRPYDLIAFLLGVAAVATATIYAHYRAAFALGLATIALVATVHATIPRWHCRRCGRHF